MRPFPEQLRRDRKKAGLTQEALAVKLRVSHAIIQRWERGVTIPNDEMRRRLCEFFEWPGIYIAVDSGERDTARLLSQPQSASGLALDDLALAAVS